ncbi:TetR/AcrR family transcriptional regulator [Zavarzinia compransoris]|nr:TetR/AcrR family transcriptional regulator [Zavarzinia compransoris]TDP46860.1 TetR family transcriptional regulator [Zavarzinia compransoris]
MSEAHRRPKQPDILRRHLLEVTADLSLRQGIGNVRLEAVAAAAGVSKGGLLHHFPSRQALLEALCREYLARLDRRLAEALAADPVPGGRFTRAYLAVMTAAEPTEQERTWGILSCVLFAEPAFRSRWADWLSGHLRAHAATDGGTALEIVRLAADGLWLSDMAGESADRAAVVGRLHAMTLSKEPTC